MTISQVNETDHIILKRNKSIKQLVNSKKKLICLYVFLIPLQFFFKFTVKQVLITIQTFSFLIDSFLIKKNVHLYNHFLITAIKLRVQARIVLIFLIHIQNLL